MIYTLHTGQGAAALGLILGLSALGVPVMGASGALVWWAGRRSRPRIRGNRPAGAAQTILLVGSEGGSTWGFAATLHAALTKAGQAVHLAPMSSFAPDRYSRAERIIILAATYPIGHVADWTTDPLGGEIRDGRIFGGGSADMKGAVAVLIAVMRDFADRGPFKGNLVLALAGDEERMGELGTQWLIDNVPEVKGDGVLVADVGGPSAVRIGEKGMLWIDLRATGRQAHGAHVHAGQNALDRLIDALTALRKCVSACNFDPLGRGIGIQF